MNNFSSEGKENLDIMHLAVKYNQKIFDFFSKDTDEKTMKLDFGAGFGEFCNRFDNGSNNIEAVEIDESMHFSIKCKIYQSLDETDKKFDFIYTSNVLEHIKDDNKIVELFYEKLNTGGTVRVFLPAKMSIYSKMDEVVGHYRRYEKKSLIKLFEDAGFEVNYCHFFDSLGFFASYIYNKINKTGVVDKHSIIFYDKFLFPISLLADELGFKYIVGKNLMLEAIKNK
jgi:predicted SAM-dependent methyltransferase